MRKIKFRAWDKERQEMIYQDKHTCFYIADEFIGIDCDETKNYDYREWSWNGGLNCELMQYTGLKDKNGVDIYEGDIVEWGIPPYNKKEKNIAYGEVFYTDGHYRIDFKKGYIYEYLQCGDLALSKIIGNIHENPELLKKGE